MTENTKPALAIIGSGIAGLACATALAERFDISIFEKSRGFSGRMSTRRAEAHQFDHGAQYFRADSDAFKTWLAPLQADGHVAAWQANSVHIGTDGQVTDKPDSRTKLVFTPTMNMVGRAILAGRPQIKAYLDCQIDKIDGGPQAWNVHQGAESFGPFEHIVLAIPAAQALALLPTDIGFTDALAKVQMVGCHTLMLGFQPNEADLSAWDCAHFDDEVLGFAAVNSRKPGRGSGDALVIQTKHEWSEARMETDLEEVAAAIKTRFEDLTGLPVSASGYDRLHRWRYASCATPLATEFLSDDAKGLSAIGDWCTGSQVENGFSSGFSLGKKLQKIL